jgi:predicted nucleotidyltransferase
LPTPTTGASPDLLARLSATLAATPGLRLGVLFGSLARGRARPDSDVDVAILPGPEGLDDRADLELQSELARAVGRDVDLVRLDRASTILMWQVARHGVALLEARAGEFARFRARAAAEYIDFAPAFLHHGEIFRRRLALGAERPGTPASKRTGAP